MVPSVDGVGLVNCFVTVHVASYASVLLENSPNVKHGKGWLLGLQNKSLPG